MAKNVLFYSKKSKQCIDILQDMNKASVSLALVCVDGLPKEKIPSFVRTVPTLYIGQNHEPLVGSQVSFWINLQSQQKQQQQTAQYKAPPVMSQNQQAPRFDQIPPQIQQQVPSGEPGAWHSNEMGSLYSDGYSFLDGSSQMKHSFTFLGNPDRNSQVQTHIESSNDKIKTADLTSRLELFKTQREMDFQRK
jgi:hypothetical protein